MPTGEKEPFHSGAFGVRLAHLQCSSLEVRQVGGCPGGAAAGLRRPHPSRRRMAAGFVKTWDMAKIGWPAPKGFGPRGQNNDGYGAKVPASAGLGET